MALLKIDDTITTIDKENRNKVWQINVPDFTPIGSCEGYNKIKIIDDPTVDKFANHDTGFNYVAEKTYCKVAKNYRYYWTVSLTDKKPSDFMNVYNITDGDYKNCYYHGNGQISNKASISKLGDNCDYSYNPIIIPTDTSTESCYDHKGNFEYICGKNGFKYMVTRHVESKTSTTYTGTQVQQTQWIESQCFFYNTCIGLGVNKYGIPTSSHGLDTRLIYSGSVVTSPDYIPQASVVMNVITSNTAKLAKTYYGSGGTVGQERVLGEEFGTSLGLTPTIHTSNYDYYYVPSSDNSKGEIYYYNLEYAEDESGDCGLVRQTKTSDLLLTTNQCGKILDSDNSSYKNLFIVYFNGKYYISSKTRTVENIADYYNSALIMPTDKTTSIFNGHSDSFIYGDNSNSDFYQVTLTTGTETITTYTWSQLKEEIIGNDPCNEYIFLDGHDMTGKYGLSTNEIYSPTNTTTNKTIINPTIADSFTDAIKGDSIETLEGHSADFYYYVPCKDASGNPLSSGEIHGATRTQTNDGCQELVPIPGGATEVYKVSGGDVSTGYITKTGNVITNIKGTYDKDRVLKGDKE